MGRSQGQPLPSKASIVKRVGLVRLDALRRKRRGNDDGSSVMGTSPIKPSDGSGSAGAALAIDLEEKS